MFTTNHFIWLGACVVLIGILSFLSRRFRFSFRTAALTMAIISLCSEVSKILSHMEFVNGVDVTEGMVIDPGALPLHLCSLLIFVYFYLPFSKEGKLRSFLTSLCVPIGIIGASLALLMATSGTDFTSPEPYQCFLYHAAMIWFSGYLIATKQVDLGKKAWLTNMGVLFALAVGMLWVNGALRAYDTNFFFVVRPPVEGLPLLNLDNGWYAYFAAICLCGLVGLTAVHLPFILKKKM